MHLLNDLAVDAGLLILNSVGVFSIYRFNDILQQNTSSSFSTRDHTPPKLATSFVACPSSTSLNIRAGYRSDGYLAYCGPTNINESADSGNTNQLTIVNLIEEQVAQTINIPGNAQVTALSVHPTKRTILVGLSDGVVKCFDDRMRNGSVAAVSNIVPPRGSKGEPILSLSHYDHEQSDVSKLYAATASALRIFDTRNYTTTVDVTASGGPQVVQHNGAVFTGLLSVAFADGSLDLMNFKLESVLPKGLLKPAHSSQGGNGAWIHPLRPIALLGNEFVRLN